MKKKSLWGIAFSVLILCFSLTCSPDGTSKVTIRIDLGLQNKAAFNKYENSIIDRVFRLFAKDVEAQNAPSNISSLTLNITGDGMTTITKSYTPPIPDTITINEVPSGSSRTFEVLAYTPSATLRGAATRDLASGATVTIPISMGLYETKIVIPDRARIVQIDDVAEPGTVISRDATFFSISSLAPYDVDFDSSGRIYFANNDFSVNGGIFRIEDINDNSADILVGSAITSLCSVKVDRVNNLIYYATSTALYRHDLTTATPLTISAGVEIINTIRGMAFVNSSTMFIAGLNASAQPRVFNYNPTTQQVVATYSTYLALPWDVIFKAPYIYIANLSGAGINSQIIQLNTDFTLPIGFGQNVDISNTTSGNFYGPRRFLATLNRKITIIDDDNGLNLDKLISIDDISGTNWTTYGNSTVAYDSGQFDFYYYC
jgi:hypothetical protein